MVSTGCSSRRRIFQSIVATAASIITTTTTTGASTVAYAVDVPDPRAIVTIRLESSNDRLGLQLANTSLRGKPIVFIQQVPGTGTKLTRKLDPGMIVLDYQDAKDIVNRIKNGPYPIDLKFYNLAAGGDAFNDMGQTMVTPQDAFNLAKQTDDGAGELGASNGNQQKGTGQVLPSNNEEYAVTALQDDDDSRSSSHKVCGIQTRKNDLLEIEYEATALISDSSSLPPRRIIYDASYMRGTGMPYQMVLGSGDMIPGVDLGLYDMCPGTTRLLKIPPQLAYGPRGNRLFKIPPNTPLEWKIKLVSIDGTIRQDNNDQTREEREGRALY